MTPLMIRAQKLRDQGFTFKEIGKKMGVSEVRAWHLCHPKKTREWARKWQRTDKAREGRRHAAAAYREAYRFELKLKQQLGITMAEARAIVDNMKDVPDVKPRKSRQNQEGSDHHYV